MADIFKDQVSGSINLHYLWKRITHLVDSSRFVVKIINDLIKEDSFGGKTLTMLYNIVKCNNRNERHFDTIFRLLLKASEPYFEMLNCWLKSGTFFDPLHEFMVIDDLARTQQTPINFIDYGNCDNRYSLRPKVIFFSLF